MSLANWSDIIGICDDLYLEGSLSAVKRRKISFSPVIKRQKPMEHPAQEKPEKTVIPGANVR